MAMPQIATIAASHVFTSVAAAGATIATATQVAQIAYYAVSLGSSLLLTTAANALLSKKATTSTQNSQLSTASTAPSYRYVYGRAKAVATPAGTPVRGDYIVGCWILNSRPSSLEDFRLFLDTREVAVTGDPFDFEGDGATSTDELFDDGILRFWISRGDKTSPPDYFTDNYPHGSGEDDELWKTTDGWQGITVLWAILDAGDNNTRSDRWPSTPPYIEIEGDWSLVYDPREPSHDIDDPDTWEFSDNWALCVTDALINNPIKSYTSSNLDFDLISYAADVSDEIVDKVDGTEKRYTLGGTLVFDGSEIEDQVLPMVAAAGGSIARVGGKISVIPAAYQEPDITINRFFGDSLAATDLASGDTLVNELRTYYTSPERSYETAELEPYEIPGAFDEDGGVASVEDLNLQFCVSATQAMRVRKIIGGLRRRQKSLSVVLGPEALDLIPGSTVTLDLESPWSIFNGIYEIQSMQPGLDLIGSSGVAMRIPVTMTKHSEDIYDWDPEVDEEEITEVEYISGGTSSYDPGSISVEVGEYNNGATITPRIKFFFDPAASSAVQSYEVSYKVDSGDWVSHTEIDGSIRDSVYDKVFGYLSAAPTQTVVIRVRSVSIYGKSSWVESSEINVDFNFVSISAVGDSGLILFSGTTPDEATFSYMVIFKNSVDDFSTATEFSDHIDSFEPNQYFYTSEAEDPGTNFYWIVPYTTTGIAGTPSSSFELTVT